MYEDALELDCRALPIALMMRAPTTVEHHSKLGDVWKKVPNDKLMDLARKLVGLDQDFSEKLKLMLFEGKIRVHVTDPSGKVHKIRDPRVIDFDDVVLSPDEFFTGLELFLAQIKC